MGVLGDTLDEFKKASPQEKVFIGVGVVAAVAVLLYVRSQNSSSSTPAQGATGASLTGGASGGGGGGIQTVPGPNSSSVPILPPGLNPIFDSQGNLLGYQPITQGTLPTSTPTSTPTSNPVAFNPRAPQLPFGTNVPSKTGSLFTYNGTTYTTVAGPGGIIYGAVGRMSASQAQNTPIGTGKYVLVAPKSAYNTTSIKQGGGPYGTKVLSVHGSRIAPTRERGQATVVTSLYSTVSRHHR